MSAPTPALQARLQKSVLLLSQARTLEQSGQLPQAVQLYQQAINLYPQNPAGYAALTSLLLGIGDAANAEKVMRAVPAEVYRQSPTIRFRHARLLMHQRQYEEALAVLEGVSNAAEVDKALLSFNQGICHAEAGRPEAALEAYASAHARGLCESALFHNWARVHHQLAHVTEAARLYREAEAKFPDALTTRYEHAVFLLKSENYQEGFFRYHSRWQSGLPEFVPCEAAQRGMRLWDGVAPVRSLLIGREQGIGDQIALSALLPAMATRHGSLTVALDPRLAPLITRSFPGLNVLGTALTAEEASNHDAYLPAADMGLHALEGVGWPQGYLRPDPARVQALRDKYRQQFPGKQLVGISWQSKRAALGEEKSVELAAWRGILARPDCQFISLQYGDTGEDRRQVREALGVEIHVDAEVDSYHDIDGLAAQIHALDLVITTSNSTAHVAAATDAPVWVLLPMGAGLLWYWGFRDTSAWYPRARLFRCQRPGEWTPVLAAVEAALGERMGAH